MIRPPPRSTLFPYHYALPISWRWNFRSFPTASTPKGSTTDHPFRLATISYILCPLTNRLARDILPPKRISQDRKSTRLNSSHSQISYAVFCLQKKKNKLRVHS